jgi:hypothetical protein
MLKSVFFGGLSTGTGIYPYFKGLLKFFFSIAHRGNMAVNAALYKGIAKYLSS